MGHERRSWLERFEAAYPLVIGGMMNAGNVVMTLAQTVIISFGMLFILVALMLVEQVGIQDGLIRVMTDGSVAAFAAFAVVCTNLVIDLSIVYIEHKERYKRPPKMQWSLRLFADSLRYRLGYDERWKARRQSPAQQFINARMTITFVIFVVALGGRMKTSIESAGMGANGLPITAGESIHRLLYESSLSDMMDWLIGTTFTMWSVFAVQNFTHYMAVKVADIQDELKVRERNAKAAQTRQRRREEKEARALERIATPDVHPVNSLNGMNERSEQDIQRTYSVNSATGYSKRMDARTVIREFFERHPERMNEQLDALKQSIEQESGVKVGRTSIHNVRQDMRK
jgi:hypothetical protein